MDVSNLLVPLLLISICVATVSPQSAPDKNPVPQLGNRADQNSPTPLGKLVDVGGYRVHLFCTGTGSPAVVIVGAGFSFDWGLVQPEVAKITQVCSYDHSGIGWSEDGPKDSCSLRVTEVHNALKNEGIMGPYVLVGHSLGALVARLYAGRYSDEVAGVVIVDHAISLGKRLLPPPSDATKVPPSAPPRLLGMESDPNFSKLSDQDRQLHFWAMSQPRNQLALRSNGEIMPQCFADAEAITKDHSPPLGNKPLIDISTDVPTLPEYGKFQTELLSLSKNSKQIVAEKIGHFVIIDRPDVVVDALHRVVQSVRNNTNL